MDVLIDYIPTIPDPYAISPHLRDAAPSLSAVGSRRGSESAESDSSAAASEAGSSMFRPTIQLDLDSGPGELGELAELNAPVLV